MSSKIHIESNLIDSRQRERHERLFTSYKMMWEDPDNCTPKFIINTPIQQPSHERQLSDPLIMLRSQLDVVESHIRIGDDRLPTVRVEFGTGQIAAAFGCELYTPPNNLPAVSSHVLEDITNVYKLKKPSLDSGWFPKLKTYTDVWRANLPDGIWMQMPDIQSPFNTAHLIRGNQIFLDFYDYPNEVDLLLDIVTDYMLEIVPYLEEMICSPVMNNCLFDYGALWKGRARISNCSMHMISPELYLDHVFSRDSRFLDGIDGGRIHYCGTSQQVIKHFFKLPNLTGFDFTSDYHSLWKLSEYTPKKVTLCAQIGDMNSATGQRLLSGDWPSKRNIILITQAPSQNTAFQLLGQLRKSVF